MKISLSLLAVLALALSACGSAPTLPEAPTLEAPSIEAPKVETPGTPEAAPSADPAAPAAPAP
jgi:hypothetical protein